MSAVQNGCGLIRCEAVREAGMVKPEGLALLRFTEDAETARQALPEAGVAGPA